MGAASGPPRSAGVLGLLQAAAMGVAAAYLGGRWLPLGVLAGAVGVLQLWGAVQSFRGEDGKWSRWAAIANLVLVALCFGLHLQLALHIADTFTPIGAKTGWALLGGAAGASLGASLIPTIQLFVFRGQPRREQLGAVVASALVLLLPPLGALPRLIPQAAPVTVDGQAAAEWTFARWEGQGPPPFDDATPVQGVVQFWSQGELLSSQPLDGPLSESLGALSLPELPSGERGVVVELSTASRPLRTHPLQRTVWLLVPGGEALRGPEGWVGSVPLWREEHVRRRKVDDALWMPTVSPKAAPGATEAHQMAAWIASSSGSAPLQQGWTAPEPLTPDNLRASAVAGAHMLAANMRPDGRYAYIVRGPSGDWGKGYNYPRHAGTTWFLARVWQRTGDPTAREAALAGVAHLSDVSVHLDDGRAFVSDPARSDGKAWVGTTALALLALTTLDVEPELQQAYADFISSAVTEQGVVQGDIGVQDGVFAPQPQVTYAQGQGLLALAAAERAGLEGVSEPLDRAIAYVDGDYWPMPAARMGTLDEHWMCLAMIATHQQRGVAAGEAVCDAYLQHVAWQAPVPGSPTQPASGPAAGLAEAVIARAELDRRRGVPGPMEQRGLEYAASMLASQYRPTDGPFLGHPERLLGGYRNTPWDGDVQIDAVQHIGCALLGAEQLLAGAPLPGGMP